MSLKNQLHKADIGGKLKGLIEFPTPLGPLEVTCMGQVSALQLHASLYEAGFKPPAIQAWLPAHLVVEPFSITNKLHADAYDQALSSYLGFVENYTHTLTGQAITYFVAQAKFDKRAGLVSVLGSPGLFMPYALAYINKTITNSRGPYATWSQALDMSRAMLMTSNREALLTQAMALVSTLQVNQLQQILKTYGGVVRGPT